MNISITNITGECKFRFNKHTNYCIATINLLYQNDNESVTMVKKNDTKINKQTNASI